MAKKKTKDAKSATQANDVEDQAQAKQMQVKLSGKTTRAKGHLGASTRRSQGKRDAKNS